MGDRARRLRRRSEQRISRVQRIESWRDDLPLQDCRRDVKQAGSVVRSVKTPNPASFRQRVLTAVRRIPPGRVATYGDVASLAGSPRAWRAVGNIMRECRDPGTPCHRVIGAGGALGGYGGNLQLKRELLRAESIEVGPNRVRNFSSIRWQGRRT